MNGYPERNRYRSSISRNRSLAWGTNALERRTCWHCAFVGSNGHTSSPNEEYAQEGWLRAVFGIDLFQFVPGVCDRFSQPCSSAFAVSTRKCHFWYSNIPPHPSRKSSHQRSFIQPRLQYTLELYNTDEFPLVRII